MASAHRFRLSSRPGVPARSGRVRALPRRYSRRLFRTEALSRRASPKAIGSLGPETADAENFVGCRSYYSGSRGRGRVRSRKSPDAVLVVPPRADGRIAPPSALGEGLSLSIGVQ